MKEVVADFRVPCPHCEGGAIRMLVTPYGADAGMVWVSVMHSVPDCSRSDEVTAEETLELVDGLVARIRLARGPAA